MRKNGERRLRASMMPVGFTSPGLALGVPLGRSFVGFPGESLRSGPGFPPFESPSKYVLCEIASKKAFGGEMGIRTCAA